MSKPNLPQPDPARRAHDKTYRARGIPEMHNIPATRELLQSILELERSNSVLVRSLAPNPYSELQGSPSKTATFTLKEPCSKLDDQGRNSWSFTLPEDPEDWDRPYRMQEIIIDTHFLGFTPLSTPSAQSTYEADIIAISGLGGHAFGSFKERGGTYMWLRDALPTQFPNVRVLIYGYDTHLAGSQSFQCLEDIAMGLRSALTSIREPLLNDGTIRPMIFIVHSLGGLVLKEALVQMKRSQMLIDQWNLQSTYGILFFGVPSQGMDVTSLRPMVEGQDNWSLLAGLIQDSAQLVRLHEDFCYSFNFPDSPLITYFETQKSPTAKKDANGRWTMSGEPVILVSKTSATQRRPWEYILNHTIQAIPKNHSDLVKFGPMDSEYYHVRAQLANFIRCSAEVIRRRKFGISASNFPGQPSEPHLQPYEFHWSPSALPSFGTLPSQPQSPPGMLSRSPQPGYGQPFQPGGYGQPIRSPSPNPTYSPPPSYVQERYPQSMQPPSSKRSPSRQPSTAQADSQSSQSDTPKSIQSPQPQRAKFSKHTQDLADVMLAYARQAIKEPAPEPQPSAEDNDGRTSSATQAVPSRRSKPPPDESARQIALPDPIYVEPTNHHSKLKDLGIEDSGVSELPEVAHDIDTPSPKQQSKSDDNVCPINQSRSNEEESDTEWDTDGDIDEEWDTFNSQGPPSSGGALNRRRSDEEESPPRPAPAQASQPASFKTASRPAPPKPASPPKSDPFICPDCNKSLPSFLKGNHQCHYRAATPAPRKPPATGTLKCNSCGEIFQDWVFANHTSWCRGR